jgi:hypothetical protein
LLIYERLRAEYEYTGGYTIVKDCMRQSRIGGQEMSERSEGSAQSQFSSDHASSVEMRRKKSV